MIGAWRYKNKVLHNLDYIFRPVGTSVGKWTAILAFGSDGWKAQIRRFYDGRTTVSEASAIVAAVAIPAIVETQSPNARQLALYAIEQGNGDNPLANKLLQTLENIHFIENNSAVYDAARLNIIGSLSGRSGDQLTNWRSARILEGLITGALVRDAINPDDI